MMCQVGGVEKLYQAVVARNDQTNLGLTLNMGAGDASLAIFVIDGLLN